MRQILGKWTVVGVACFLFTFGACGLHAESSGSDQELVSSKSLADSVDRIVQIMSYVDSRLLSEENVRKIEESGNYEAIAILQRSLQYRELITAQINEGRFDEAYLAMRSLGNDITDAIRKSWEGERIAQQQLNRIETERTISDAYLVRAKQRGIHSGDWGGHALMLFQRAQEKRAAATELVAQKDFHSAAAEFQKSTELLQKAIAFTRNQDRTVALNET